MKNLSLKEYFVDKRNIKKILLESDISKKELTWVNRWNHNIQTFFPSYWEKHFSIPIIINSKVLNGLVLDFGCGSGHLTIELAKLGLNIYGIDYSKVGIIIANYYKNQQKLEVKKRLTFKSIEVKDFKPNFKFDSCLISHVLEHLKVQDAKLIVTELKRLLNRNAKILIAVPYGENFKDPQHCNFFYTLEDLNEFIIDIGLNVIKSYIEDKVIYAIISSH